MNAPHRPGVPDHLVPNVTRFPDGSLGLIFGTQAMQFNPAQAKALIECLADDSRSAMNGANARQVGGNHYHQLRIQVWDAIEAWGLGFIDGNVVKYIARHRNKGGIEDLQKAKHYLDKLIEQNSVRVIDEAHEAAVRG